MAVVLVHDAIHANVSSLPAGQTAGYTTGSSIIKWTDADWKAHPAAVRIDQDFAASDPSADVLDVERGAATNGEAARWYRQALADFSKVVRPGQRHPAIYTSAANVSALVNALIADGVKSGPGLWVANWNLTSGQAAAEVVAAAGPFPVIGVQFSDGSPGRPFDTSVFSGSWLANRAHKPDPAGPVLRHTSAVTSLAAIAQLRNTTVDHLISLLLANLSPADKELIARLQLPAGFPYYTSH